MINFLTCQYKILVPKVYDDCSDDWKMWSRTSCFIWPLGVLYYAGLQRLPFSISGLSENTQFQKGSGIPCLCGSSQITKVICLKCTWMRRIVLIGVLKVTKEVGYIRRTSLAPQYCMLFRSIPFYSCEYSCAQDSEVIRSACLHFDCRTFIWYGHIIPQKASALIQYFTTTDWKPSILHGWQKLTERR